MSPGPARILPNGESDFGWRGFCLDCPDIHDATLTRLRIWAEAHNRDHLNVKEKEMTEKTNTGAPETASLTESLAALAKIAQDRESDAGQYLSLVSYHASEIQQKIERGEKVPALELGKLRQSWEHAMESLSTVQVLRDAADWLKAEEKK